MSAERTFTHLKDSQASQNKMPNEDTKKHWEEKLVGKKIVDDSSSVSSFSKRDLPEKHRVVSPGAMVTRDFYPDRLNVHVGEDGTCSHVTMG